MALTWATMTLTGADVKATRPNELSRFVDADLDIYIAPAKGEVQDDIRQMLSLDPNDPAGADAYDVLADTETRLIKRAWTFKTLYLLWLDMFKGAEDQNAERLDQYKSMYNNEKQQFGGLVTSRGRVRVQSHAVYK